MKKLNLRDFTVLSRLPLVSLIIVILVSIFSCQPDDNELGRDILPPGDSIAIHFDTLYNFSSYAASGFVFESSEDPLYPQPNRLFLLGYTRDTIVGLTQADIVTQVTRSATYEYVENTLVDSLVLSLYFNSTDAVDFEEDLRVKIYELTNTIYIDSIYYSDYNMEGKYNPDPLVDEVIQPVDTTQFRFLITDQDFIDKFIYPENDTLFKYDSLFKEHIKGFYITAEDLSGNGFMSRIHLSRTSSLLSIKYANDSTAVDTLAGQTIYEWAHFTINEYTTQKINLFRHDYSGTSIEEIIDREDIQPDILYTQGLNGVSTKIRLDGMDSWQDSGIVSVMNAQLIFEVLPESVSGIPIDDLPERLILLSEVDENIYQPLYDFFVDESKFDGYLRPVSEGVYYDTTYIYRFNIGLHYQSVINGELDNYDLVLKPYYYMSMGDYSKLWSNYVNRNERLRLELIYTKLQ